MHRGVHGVMPGAQLDQLVVVCEWVLYCSASMATGAVTSECFEVGAKMVSNCYPVCCLLCCLCVLSAVCFALVSYSKLVVRLTMLRCSDTACQWRSETGHQIKLDV